MKYNHYQKRESIKNYFPLPNEVFCLGLIYGELAVYSYLMYRVLKMLKLADLI